MIEAQETPATGWYPARGRGRLVGVDVSHAIPNRYDAGLLVITHWKTDQRFVAQYSPEDEPLLRGFHWYVMASTGYVASRIGGRQDSRTILLHRLVLGLSHGDPREGDHINGRVLDDRRENLRIVEHQRNIAHQAIRNGKGTSAFRGVSWNRDRKSWVAYSSLSGKRKALGYFPTETDAASAVAQFRRDHGLPDGY
jgi:hypothetical protein